jgi:hypothetical protein
MVYILKKNSIILYLFLEMALGFFPASGAAWAQSSGIAGLWKGTISHGTDSFSPTWKFTVLFEQAGDQLAGNVFLEAEDQYVRFALKGRIQGKSARTTEGAILEENSSRLSGNWCMNRKMELNLVAPDKLEGTWSSASAGCTGGLVKLTREQRACVSRYFVAFIARKGLPGHAFVQWVKVDAEQKMTRAEAFGLYPRKGSAKEIALGPVPGALKNEYLQNDGISGDVVLRLEVTAEEFSETLKVRDDWSRRLTTGKLTYELLERNCIDFTGEIVRVLRKLRPSLRPSTYGSTDDLSDLIGAPFRYTSQLYGFNRKDHVPISALEASCP